MSSSRKSVTNRYYPRLSEIITADDLPNAFSFIQTGIDDILNNLYFKNLQCSKSANGDTAFYSIEIISNEIGLDIPFGLRLVLNPDAQGDTSISSFPVSLQYQWKILAFLRYFDLPGFSFTPDGFFQLGLKIFKLSDVQVITNTLNLFVNPTDPSIDQYQQIIDDINSAYPNANLSIPQGQTPSANVIATQISENPNIPTSVSELMFAIYLLSANPDTVIKNLQIFFNTIVPGGIQDFIQDLIKPKAKVTLTLSAGIEFPTNILQPLDAHGVIIPNSKSIFTFAQATFYADTESGIGSSLGLGGSLIPLYAQIGTTPFVISFSNAKLDLSSVTNIPEADAAGYSSDFMGIYIQQASISFNQFGQDSTTQESASITANNILIGTGGISGTIKVQDNGVLYRNFGDFSAELDVFSLTFRQNVITNCAISGAITLNKYLINGQPAKIAIQAQLKDSGDFSITATFQTGLPPLTLPNVFEFYIRTLTLGEDNGHYYVQVAGTLNFIADIPGLGEILPKNINISKLRIYDDGHIEFFGGTITLPLSVTLTVGPVKMEVNHMSLGAYSQQLNGVARDYCYFSFDGMINTGSFGVDASGNGIKYYFTIDDGPDKPFDSFIRIDQIEIDLSIPGTDPQFILKGELSMKNPTGSSSNAATQYGGGIGVQIPSLGITGSGKMVLTPSIPSFIVDMDLELSAPIGLAGTGLGIYGFRGLIGEHYVPSKSATTPPLPDDASWWDYYKAKSTLTHTEGVEIDKFASKSGFSLGAGLTLGTVYDDGFTFSAKLFLLLGMPGVFLLEGQAGVLQSRLGLKDTTDPPFSALIAIDSTSFTGDLSVDYKLPNGVAFNGDVVALQGTLELAFYFNNASGWYLDLGKDTPDSARIQAQVLTLFKGYAYLMISAKGFKVGAGAAWNFNKKFGPVSVGAGVGLAMGAAVSFNPVQIGGFIQVAGYAKLKVFGFVIDISIQVALAVEAPHPFNIVGTFVFKLKVSIFLKIKLSIGFTWHINQDNAPLLAPVSILRLPDTSTQYAPAVAVNMLSGETFPINYVTEQLQDGQAIPPPGDSSWKFNFTNSQDVMQVTIPLDSFIDIELLKPVNPGNVFLGGAQSQLPSGYIDLLPPVKGISNQVQHQYNLTGLNIYVWDDNGSGGGSWQPYQVYEAVTAIVDANTGSGAIDLTTLAPGYWQFQQPNQFNKIRLLSQTMFSYANQSTSVVSNIDTNNFQRKDIFCYANVIEEIIINWKNIAAGTTYTDGQPFMVTGVTFNIAGLQGEVSYDSGYGGNSLKLTGMTGSLLITLPVPVTSYEIDFGPNQSDIAVYPVETVPLSILFGRVIEVDVQLAPVYVEATQQNAVVTYNNINQPVNKIQLVFNTPVPVTDGGNLNIGGYFQLPDKFLPVTTPQFHHEVDADKALAYATLFNQSFTQAEVLERAFGDTAGAVGQWPLGSVQATAGTLNGVISGSPSVLPGLFEKNTAGSLTAENIYFFSGNNAALIIPENPVLNVESGNFAFEITVNFSPYTSGISTLLSKINTPPLTILQRGFALHLYMDNPGYPSTTYGPDDTIPTFTIWMTAYGAGQSVGISATDSYTVDCTSSELAINQYRTIMVSIDREASTVDIYIDKILKTSAALPAELDPVVVTTATTTIDQLSYLTETLQQSQSDSGITSEGVISEIDMLNNNINKTIQPVWRPNSTFAVTVTTKDIVSQGSAIDYTQVFGFQTAGPIGHFQQQSAVYQALVASDETDQFRLADLKDYIDYERSYPDAQSRYNLSKPVLLQTPQINLYFLAPYINAMYANWNSYQGLSAVQSSLTVTLTDPAGNVLTPQLVWVPLPDVVINSGNYRSLPPDQQLLFLMDQAASQDGCNINPVTIIKHQTQGVYQFPDLVPNKIYTAIFNAVYQPAGQEPQIAEVHKFTFLTSLFSTFQEQASSFILDSTPGAEIYAVYPMHTAFTAAEITGNLLPLLNSDPANDAAEVLVYPIQYDRIVSGGLALINPEKIVISNINPVINIDPGNNSKTILGIIMRNPESFNDPKIPAADLADTVQMTLTKADNSVLGPSDFLYFYSADTSAVFITNAAMNIAPGNIQVDFRYKIFNGSDYETVHEDYSSPQIAISTD